MEKLNDLVIENAQIRFRNFSGKPTKFNSDGKRNFAVLINEEMVETLKDDGWNIKRFKPREDDEIPQAYMNVAVSYEVKPPKIYIVTKKSKTLLTEDTVGSLDWADIENVDIIINPYPWEMNGKTGIKAYVKTMYVTIADDILSDKYDDSRFENELPF